MLCLSVIGFRKKILVSRTGKNISCAWKRVVSRAPLFIVMVQQHRLKPSNGWNKVFWLPRLGISHAIRKPGAWAEVQIRDKIPLEAWVSCLLGARIELHSKSLTSLQVSWRHWTWMETLPNPFHRHSHLEFHVLTEADRKWASFLGMLPSTTSKKQMNHSSARNRGTWDRYSDIFIVRTIHLLKDDQHMDISSEDTGDDIFSPLFSTFPIS